MSERDRTQRLANQLGGEHQVWYDHGIGRRGYIDVKVGRWAIEYDSTRKKAIEDAEKRVAHHHGSVLAVWPCQTQPNVLCWRCVSPRGSEPDSRGVNQLKRFLVTYG